MNRKSILAFYLSMCVFILGLAAAHQDKTEEADFLSALLSVKTQEPFQLRYALTH